MPAATRNPEELREAVTDMRLTMEQVERDDFYEQRGLKERRHSVAVCGSPDCAGCYEVAPGVRFHPPKASADYLAWEARWEKERQKREFREEALSTPPAGWAGSLERRQARPTGTADG